MNGDVIHLSWLLDCMAQKVLLVVSPKYVPKLSTDSCCPGYFLIGFEDHLYGWDTLLGIG